VKTLNPHPGKFEGNDSQLLAEVVYNKSLDGCCEELGDVESFGWHGLVRGKRYTFILSEGSSGFVYVAHGSHEEMQAQWDELQKEYEASLEESEEE
jgi:hypothetical protein